MIQRMLNIIFLIFFSNFYMVFFLTQSPPILNILVLVISVMYFVAFNIIPRWKKKFFSRGEVLMGGRELIICAFILLMADICISIIFLQNFDFDTVSIVFSELGALLIFFIIALNGTLRIIFASTQLSLVMRLALFFTWWIPILNVFVCWRYCRVARHEYLYLLYKEELNESRKENDLCKMKYPLLMVHGIFWRDWQIFNYWGRISKELLRNGAVVYYGNQQSAAPMEICASELKAQILRILEKEHCEKVNIIAHSKGGLDARYAISCLDAAPYVASLTTIGTPHLGCSLVDIAIKKVPDSIMRRVTKGYNAMYKKLGDTDPDFRSGINDLTTEQCAIFNQEVIDKETILYSSVASKMTSFFGADFPLNVGYSILRRTDGDNDGFVSVASSKWGHYLGTYETKHRRGVSHGDMIDLTRKNIKGFDASECYIDIVKSLKAQGL
jgi:triacylglycerol lipase